MKTQFLDFGSVNSEIKKVLEGVGARKSCSLFGVTESLKVMLSCAFDKPLVYVTSDIVHARKIQEMFEDVFAGNVVLLPAVADNLIYKKAVSTESFVERNRALAKILSGQAKIIVTSSDALLMPLAPVNMFDYAVTSVEKGQDMERGDLIQKLLFSGYRRVDLVAEPGDFAVRGDIVDVFDVGSMRAFRIDFLTLSLKRFQNLILRPQRVQAILKK